MAIPVLTQTTSILCAHGITAVAVPSQIRVRAMGQPVLVQTDNVSVAGCPFTLPGPTPSPCVQIRWTSAATRVRASGMPILLQTSTSVCQAATQAPQGPATVPAGSPKVMAL